MLRELYPPFDGAEILGKKKKLLRVLKENAANAVPLRIAVLGGSTTSDIVKVLELFLRERGIAPSFYESEYNQYWNDAVFGNPELSEFKPELVFVHTTFRNIEQLPEVLESHDSVEQKLSAEYARFEQMWTSLSEKFGCPVIQNNFELPSTRLMGNREAGCDYGTVDFVTRLNVKFYDYARTHKNFYINDINYVSAAFGLDKWADHRCWHLYKYAMALEAIPDFAYNVSRIICSLMGRNKKLIALDLDNTLWGGIVGDDGQAGLEIGSETSEGQLYSSVQNYFKSHKKLGVLLSVCSKNDMENAVSGLEHPSGILKPDDFAVIKANWNAKPQNLSETASQLALFPDSFVFVDDNPMERDIVRSMLPEVYVPDFDTPEESIRIMDKLGFFEVTTLSEDDAARGEMYRANAQRASLESSFADYSEYLKNLDMKAKIGDFAEVNIPRITQLTNKSNQFNVTTKRYTQSEMEQCAKSPDYIRLSGQLSDKFGDNGIVSVVIGRKEQTALHVELWLMSCRVLKRDMELAMLDTLVNKCKAEGITEIFGYYYPTKKNGMVKELFGTFGFEKISEDDGNTVWRLDVGSYSERCNVIEIEGD